MTKTAEQIFKDAWNRADAEGKEGERVAAGLDALRAAGLLVGEPSEEQIERAAVDGCVFCSKISADALETDIRRGVVSFTPLGPVTPGHRLFVPLEHVQTAGSDAEVTGRTFASAAEWAVSHRIDEFNLITSAGRSATQSVFHLHVHLVPRYEGDGLALPWVPAAGVTPPAPNEPAHIPYPGKPFDPTHEHDWADGICHDPNCMASCDGTTQPTSRPAPRPEREQLISELKELAHPYTSLSVPDVAKRAMESAASALASPVEPVTVDEAKLTEVIGDSFCERRSGEPIAEAAARRAVERQGEWLRGGGR